MKPHAPIRLTKLACRIHVRKQKGATLIVTIMLMLVLTMLALTLYQFGNTEERNASNQFDHNLALQAAELALRDAEMDLQCLRRDPVTASYSFCTAGNAVTTGIPPVTGQPTLCRAICSSGTALKANRKLLGFDAVGTNGLWAGSVAAKPWLGTAPWDPDTTPPQTVVLGAQTNVAIPAIYATRPPRYMIEGFEQVPGSGQLLYRITSQGYGNLRGTVVTLQGVYKP